MGDTGLEQLQSRPRKSEVGAKRGNKSGNISGGDGAAAAGEPPVCQAPDGELAAVIRAWAVLPAAVRAGIVAMVRASSGGPVDPEASK